MQCRASLIKHDCDPKRIRFTFGMPNTLQNRDHMVRFAELEVSGAPVELRLFRSQMELEESEEYDPQQKLPEGDEGEVFLIPNGAFTAGREDICDGIMYCSRCGVLVGTKSDDGRVCWEFVDGKWLHRCPDLPADQPRWILDPETGNAATGEMADAGDWDTEESLGSSVACPKCDGLIYNVQDLFEGNRSADKQCPHCDTDLVILWEGGDAPFEVCLEPVVEPAGEGVITLVPQENMPVVEGQSEQEPTEPEPVEETEVSEFEELSKPAPAKSGPVEMTEGGYPAFCDNCATVTKGADCKYATTTCQQWKDYIAAQSKG